MTHLSAPATPRDSFLRAARRLAISPWLHLLSLALAVLINYWGLWRTYFTLDDFWMYGWIKFQPNLWAGLMTEMELGYGVRPLMDAQLWLRYSLFGLNAAPYHLISIAQHLLVVGLVYWLATLLDFPRLTAWLGTLLFATGISAFEVVHWVTGSNISLVCITGLLALCFFVLFRRGRGRLYFWLWTLCVGLTLFNNENFATLLPLFVVYDLVVALPGLPLRDKVKKLLVHLCYLIWLIPYALLQMRYVAQGTSEYGDLALGLDRLLNYGYLVYLALPGVPGQSVASFVGDRLSQAWVAVYVAGSVLLAFILFLAALRLLWRGTHVERFLVLWIVLSFLPFALWPFSSSLSSAPRYRYVPSIAFCLLVASGLAAWWNRQWTVGRVWRWLAPAFVVGVLLFNLVYHQVLNEQQTRRGDIKRQVVERMLVLPVPPEDALVVFEAPDSYFRDAKDICGYVYPDPPQCLTTFTGQEPSIQDFDTRYWMRIDYEGVQVSDGWQ